MSKLNLVTKACAVFLLWTAAAVALPAQTFTTLHNFDGTDGQQPLGLVQGANGIAYGVTKEGGTILCFPPDETYCGTVFTMEPNGTVATLYDFTGGSDREYPNSNLVQATNGDFYGVNGFTIFKITSTGTLTTIYTAPPNSDPLPNSLFQASDGNFYGTTFYGGQSGGDGDGTVFKLTPGGVLTILYSFCPQPRCHDGANPVSLIEGTDGNLYGTASAGGNGVACNLGGCGTIFKVTRSGVFTVLHVFDSTDGSLPNSLIQAGNGNFYGTTEEGGTGCYLQACGTIFEITPGGSLTTLYNFNGPDGYGPNALVQGTDGNLYGTTAYGGTFNSGEDGTVFQVTLQGTLTTLHDFDATDGVFPNSLIQATNGTFYGATAAGGANTTCAEPGGYARAISAQGEGCGTIFSVSMGLGPFVETNPRAGKVGAKIGILGSNFTGATSVTFNGTAAEFTVKSATLIIATVPSGATTGQVQVKLPKGMLSSNVPFIVLP